jgi:hypothetical protein|tara:strand:- start:3639 stop:4127 length:489 start_codon:yes stop_codon:yes gene_type:complete
MRYVELIESMSFSAGHKDPKSGYWDSLTYSGDVYAPEFYKNTEKYMNTDEPAPENPDYKPELDLTLSNASMREVFRELGYPTDLEDRAPFPIDEFIARTTQWLQKAIGKPSPEQKPEIAKGQYGATMISGGKPEGYFNRVIKDMNHIARVGKSKGATHVWAS